MAGLKPTLNVLNLYAAFLQDASGQHYALELSKTAGVSIGSIYTLLSRMEDAGMLTSEVEAVSPHLAGRPPRRYYRLTGEGLQIARHETRAAGQRFMPRSVSHA